MISPELLKKIQLIYIKSRFLANDVFAGEYETAFRGRGMEFEEVREYCPGDDIRNIDWNVSARMDRPFIKLFREEREQRVMLVVDVSASQYFGSQSRPKIDIATEVAAVLAYAAVKSNDKVGLIIFSDRVERFIPPKKGRSHVWRVISEILSFKPTGRGTRLGEALNFLNRVVRKRAVCFVISDFISANQGPTMKWAGFKHDVIAIKIQDPLEQAFPLGGLLVVRDLESSEMRLIDLGRSDVRNLYEHRRNDDAQESLRQLRSINIDPLEIRTDDDYMKPLLNFFRRREKKL